MSDHFDAIVVGSGCAGSWAAKELAEAGLTVLVLEAGPAVRPDDVPDRVASFTAPPQTSERQRVQQTHANFGPRGPHLFVDDHDHPYETPPDAPYQWIRGMQLGGRSLTWGGSALRLSAFELGAGSLDGCELAWPLGYRDLAAAYTRVEQTMGVAGTFEHLAQAPDSLYRDEPGPLTAAEKDFQETYRPPGTRPVPARFITQTVGPEGWPGYTMQAAVLSAAVRTGSVEIRAHALAVEVATDPGTGRASGVEYVGTADGSRHRVRARTIFLCCGTIETARLLLNSRSPRHPDGLGNSGGWVGRGLNDHLMLFAAGILDGDAGPSGLPYLGRQCGLVVPPAQPDAGTAHADPAGSVRPFGLWVNLQRQTADGLPVGDICAQGEMLPYAENHVTLSETRDRWGYRIPHIRCVPGPHEERLYAAMRREVESAAAAAGIRLTSISDGLTVPGGSVHDVGTARMGRDRSTSVLDADNRVWDSPNVFVTDGASFPSAGWQNPTLTIMALSSRAGRSAARMLSNGEI